MENWGDYGDIETTEHLTDSYVETHGIYKTLARSGCETLVITEYQIMNAAKQFVGKKFFEPITIKLVP